jgi:hypothetical protein
MRELGRVIQRVMLGEERGFIVPAEGVGGGGGKSRPRIKPTTNKRMGAGYSRIRGLFVDGLSAQKMAADSSVPAEMRELGRVLSRIMIGDRNVDLSSLPREWAEVIQRMKDE